MKPHGQKLQDKAYSLYAELLKNVHTFITNKHDNSGKKFMFEKGLEIVK